VFHVERAAARAVSAGMKQELEEHYESVTGTKAVERIRDVAKSARICLFGTLLNRSPLTVRPMAVQSVDDAGNLWFLSSRASHTNQHIAQNPSVQLLFSNPGDSEYMTLQGTATISDDRALREKHWTPIAKTWFNGGVDDPDLTVICVAARDGYYWDTKHGKTYSFLTIAAGMLMGKTLDDSIEGDVKL
jgi:general stress protein 26